MGKKTKDAPPPQENETPFQRFEEMAKKVVTASKPAKSNRSDAPLNPGPQ